jgi:hypothetical protein
LPEVAAGGCTKPRKEDREHESPILKILARILVTAATMTVCGVLGFTVVGFTIDAVFAPRSCDGACDAMGAATLVGLSAGLLLGGVLGWRLGRQK